MRTILSLSLILCLLGAAPASANEAAAWSALRTGNAIALMRHADAPGGVGDPQGFRLEDCATQRNLSARGRTEAAAVGKAFRDRGVKPARILSSPWCRCVDTAKLMDVGTVELETTFGNPVVWTDRREAMANGARTIVSAWTGPGALLVLTHGALIAQLTGYNPASGEIVVVDNTLKEIGRIPVPR
ncbi:MAG: histidine phosphatase family protein [Alphaproteobacteria bacterium]|nr:histidine phosphatase family protein [Alphaproteobacteria bacterium]MCW5740782.1 histidine phosphatase family protein [Alphaproteobacteria bacterium]